MLRVLDDQKEREKRKKGETEKLTLIDFFHKILVKVIYTHETPQICQLGLVSSLLEKTLVLKKIG
jgi:hypothetical protein